MATFHFYYDVFHVVLTKHKIKIGSRVKSIDFQADNDSDKTLISRAHDILLLLQETANKNDITKILGEPLRDGKRVEYKLLEVAKKIYP